MAGYGLRERADEDFESIYYPLGSALFGGLLALILGFAGRRRLALGDRS